MKTATIICCSLLLVGLTAVCSRLYIDVAHAASGPDLAKYSLPNPPLANSPCERAPADTVHLAAYTFDFQGNCTPEGWVGTDLTGAFGSFSGLFKANSVLQQDLCLNAAGCLWGFFDNSPDDYGCGGFPQQPAVPFGNGQGLYLSNEIWSQEIEITGSGDEFVLGFHVYRDLPLDNLVFYSWRIRSTVGGIPREWRGGETVYYGGDRDWIEFKEEIGSLIEPGASHIRIALGCHDLAGLWRGIVGLGSCHSQGPLFGRVTLDRVDRLGPSWRVRPIDLFQDNFATDGTATGAVRADAALDVLPRTNPAIQPGDSVCVTVSAFDTGLDYNSSGVAASGPAVYLHVKNVSPAKSGNALTDDPLRWPVVSNSGGWTVLRMDSAYATSGLPVPNRYCVDLNDNLFTPGDTVYYHFSARDAGGRTTYWSRCHGSNVELITDDPTDAAANALEFTCLPAKAPVGEATYLDILYIDDADDGAGPPQLSFETAFDRLGNVVRVDRYDVLGSSSLAGNGPGSRVADIVKQIFPSYQIIIWDSGDMESGLIGDGGGPEKSPDAQFLSSFFDRHPSAAGVYISGDHVAEEWKRIASPAIADLEGFIQHIAFGNHIELGVPVSPLVTGVEGSVFWHDDEPDELIAFGGCPIINRFDVLQPAGEAFTEMLYNNPGTHSAVISQAKYNSVGSVARVLLSGFAFQSIRDAGPVSPPARVEFLIAALSWLYGAPQIGRVSFTSFEAAAGEAAVTLDWTVDTTLPLRGFGIYRRAEADTMETLVNPDTLLTPSAERYVDTDITGGVTYTYVTAAVMQQKLSEHRSPPDTVTALGAPPPPPPPDTPTYVLRQNAPNPFGSATGSGTTIRYSIGERAHVTIKIYDIAGRLVKTLVNATLDPSPTGLNTTLDGRSDAGDPVGSGVYFYQIVTTGFAEARKMVVVR